MALAVTLLGQNEAKPNFTGRWRMVKEKSQFHGLRVPEQIVRVVDQRGTVLNLHTVQTVNQKTTMSDISYFIDGAVATNSINGRDAQSKGFWDGQTLVITTKMKNASNLMEVIEDRWDLSADGKTLTTMSHIITEKGEIELTLVCAKENQPAAVRADQ